MLLYAVAILVSAFLLFQIEPIIAKIILPWFGGSAAVWTTCLLFFQLVLLLGYVYAHWSVRRFTPRRQAHLHMALLVLSLAALPAIPAPWWKPSGPGFPVWRILALLTATIGLPYALLSTTGPLVQAWYAEASGDRLPYRLFALSNLGSLLALVTYPFVLEPAAATRQQAMLWSAGYVLFVVICGAVAFARARQHGKALNGAGTPAPKPSVRLHLLWLALAACPSILLLAVTTHLTQNIAAIPFLWVVPLSLYLLSFILCFEGNGWYRRSPFLQLFAVSVAGMSYTLSDEFGNASPKVLVPLFAAGLFFCSMTCHGELARLKPEPRFLTSFYLMLSAGGAVGGIFVGLAAPALFSGYYELPIGLALCAALVLGVVSADKRSGLLQENARGRLRPSVTFVVVLLLVIAMSAYLFRETLQTRRDARVFARNFYGALRILDSPATDDGEALRKLMNGSINHGQQILAPGRSDQPTSYYGPDSGVGLTLRTGAGRQQRVGVIGLGTGTLAAYGNPGDVYRFYEINPLVLRLAETQFSFVKDSKARVDVELGDARLSLEREPPQLFDVLALDAFSGDSIPVHLLTREAFQLYFRHLKPDGVLAVHVSNKYLDLKPVVQLAVGSLGKKAMWIENEDDEPNAVFSSSWVVATSRSSFFDDPQIKAAAKVLLDPRADLRMWTDDYSNLFQILK
jgi:SAM-dependent methyltransferase